MDPATTRYVEDDALALGHLLDFIRCAIVLVDKLHLRRGVAESCLFCAVTSLLKVVIHVDDPLATGR